MTRELMKTIGVSLTSSMCTALFVVACTGGAEKMSDSDFNERPVKGEKDWTCDEFEQLQVDWCGQSMDSDFEASECVSDEWPQELLNCMAEGFSQAADDYPDCWDWTEEMMVSVIIEGCGFDWT